MTRRTLFLPLAALIAFAAYLGWQLGQPPTDAEIINRYAAAYLDAAPTGASPTDCTATPHPDAAIRMVISCAHPFGLTTTYFVGPLGDVVPAPQGPST
jgi:hypothetical protein